MIDFNRHIAIENYLSGAMSKQEKAAFEQKLATDSALQKEVNLQKSANLLVKEAAKMDLKTKLNQIHQQSKAAEQQKQSNRNKTLAVAAVALLVTTVLLIAYQYFNQNNVTEQTPEEQLEQSMKSHTSSSAASDAKVNNDSAVISASKTLSETNNTAVKADEPGTIKPINNKEAVNSTPLTGDLAEQKQNTTIPSQSTGSDTGLKPRDSGDEKNENNQTNQPDKNTTTTVDPCEAIEKISPHYQVTEPCFGEEAGEFSLLAQNDAQFTSYSLHSDGQFVPNWEKQPVPVGSYRLVATDEQNCSSAVVNITVAYKNCNHVIQAANFRYMEINVPATPAVLKFEVRNARSGAIVFTELLEQRNEFQYKGVNQTGAELPIGAYVFTFSSSSNKLIAQGQITVIK